MVAHVRTRLNFCNPVVYFQSPKTETGVAQFTPADVLCYFSNKEGLLHTLTELLLSVILPDFLLHSSRLNYLSPQSILGISGHHPLQLFTLFYQRLASYPGHVAWVRG